MVRAILSCPNCHRGIKDVDARYCPYCSKSLCSERICASRTKFPVASGLLSIIAASLALELASETLAEFSSYVSVVTWNWQRLDILRIYGTQPYQWLLMMTLGFATFGLGIIGGIVATERRHFGLAVSGSLALIITGLVTILDYPGLLLGIVVGPPLLTLGLASFLFQVVSRREFL